MKIVGHEQSSQPPRAKIEKLELSVTLVMLESL